MTAAYLQGHAKPKAAPNCLDLAGPSTNREAELTTDDPWAVQPAVWLCLGCRIRSMTGAAPEPVNPRPFAAVQTVGETRPAPAEPMEGLDRSPRYREAASPHLALASAERSEANAPADATMIAPDSRPLAPTVTRAAGLAQHCEQASPTPWPLQLSALLACAGPRAAQAQPRQLHAMAKTLEPKRSSALATQQPEHQVTTTLCAV